MKYILLILFSSHLFSQSADFVKYRSIENGNIKAYISNDGRLGASSYKYYSILWPKDVERPSEVYDHGLWVVGFRNDSLVGAVPFYMPGYTPGPNLYGYSATVVSPEDSDLYRSYLIHSNSAPGDPDYDEWPSRWGAPIHRDGTPKLTGDIMLWTVYNDARSDVKFYSEPHNHHTFIEIHETIWGYNQPGILEDVLFFKWQIYNKSNQRLDSVFVCHWNDINVFDPTWDLSGYDLSNDFGYIYDEYVKKSSEDDYDTEILSYFLLQGPTIQNEYDIAYSFGVELAGHSNLPVTGFWGIDSDTTPFWLFGAFPRSLQEVYYFVTGRRYDGSPIINPVNGDTTWFTFTGDPVTKEGWIMTQRTGGESGYIISSGPFKMAPSDSQEIIIALTAAQGDSLKDAYDNLHEKIRYVKSFYNDSLKILPKGPPLIPESFLLSQNYPNPFNTGTKIMYAIPKSGEVRFSFYNVLGEEIENVVKSHNEPGNYFINWSPQNISTGIYFYMVQFENHTETKKCLYLK
jgi:hypothetical protein